MDSSKIGTIWYGTDFYVKQVGSGTIIRIRIRTGRKVPDQTDLDLQHWLHTVKSPNFVKAHNFVTTADNFCEALIGF
jgi:hypothetical protein